jgi:serine/threonine protein kinase
MAITTVEGFLEALEKSKLLDEGQLAEARQIASETAEVKALARTLIQKGLLSRWQAAQLLAGRTTVFFLGKYKLIELLGRGGMGGVFLAQHTMMNRRVALKVVSKQIAQDPAALEQFLAEARAIAALDHPNIVRAYNVDCEEGRYYLVMEYVEGKDLQRLVEEEGPLDFQKVVDYIRQAAEGLAHAHQHNLIHCDIKPSNLLVTPEGVVKILDLGLARWAASHAEQEEKEADPRLVGTVDYQAPEVGLGEKVDARADIYSLGCTMFFLLTGKPPFGEGTLHERILKHQTQPPPDIASLRPGTPKDLILICRKMMAKKPADRFQSVEEVSKLLARWKPPQPKLRKAVPLEDSDSSAKIATAGKPSPAKGTKEATDSGLSPTPESQPVGVAKKLGKTPSRLAQLPSWVWIAGGAGVVVLVGLSIVLLVLAFSSGKQETAKAKGKSLAGGPKVQKEEPTSLLNQNVAPGFNEKPEPPPSEKPSVSPSPKEEPGTKPPSKPPEERPESKPEKTPPEKSKSEPSPKPEAKPSEPLKEQPASKEKSTPPEKPDTSKPSTKPKEKQPSEKPKPQPEPKKSQPVSGDFWDEKSNPKPIDLPELDKPPTEPIARPLGKMKLEDMEARWYLDLVGGNLVFKGTQQFQMERRRTDTGFLWDILLRKATEEKGSGGGPTPVAQFEYKTDTQELWFRWLPGADPESANLLRNCVLDVNYRGESFPIFLRRPVQVPPIELQPLKAGTKPLTIQVPHAPANPERFLWEFTSPPLQEPSDWKNHKELQALKYKVAFEPVTASTADPKKPFLLKFLWIDRANNEKPLIVFQILPQGTGGRYRLDARLINPKLQFLRMKPPLDEAIRFRKLADSNRATLEADAKKDPKQRMSEKDRSALLQAINEYDAKAWMIKMQHLLEGGLTIHYKVFYQLGRFQVLLAQSSDQAAAEKK